MKTPGITLFAIVTFAGLLFSAQAGEGLARFSADFSEPAPDPGWKYLVNEQDFSINEEGAYRELVWNDAANGYCAEAEKYPAGTPFGYAKLDKSGGHPGNSERFDRFVIAAYTLPAGTGGTLKIEGSRIVRKYGQGAVAVIVRVNNEIKKQMTVDQTEGQASFDCDLGALKAGDVIYVGVGADGNADSDRFFWDFGIARVH